MIYPFAVFCAAKVLLFFDMTKFCARKVQIILFARLFAAKIGYKRRL